MSLSKPATNVVKNYGIYRWPLNGQHIVPQESYLHQAGAAARTLCIMLAVSIGNLVWNCCPSNMFVFIEHLNFELGGRHLFSRAYLRWWPGALLPNEKGHRQALVGRQGHGGECRMVNIRVRERSQIWFCESIVDVFSSPLSTRQPCLPPDCLSAQPSDGSPDRPTSASQADLCK